jgi:flagellar operon protein
MNKFLILNHLRIHSPSKAKPTLRQENFSKPFSEVLNKTINDIQDIKFSKHAVQKLESRNIQLNQDEILKLEKALNKAKQKGIRETLILMDNKAFIASVANRTIITAALDEQLKENVFTNIDGAVII